MAALKTPDGFRIERGLLWPDYDRRCAEVVFDWEPDIDVALAHVKKFGCVVQAGGNCGVWPINLAKRFDRVLTFEPDPMNFTALAFNTAHLKNVVRVQAALGVTSNLVGMEEPERENCGALRVGAGGLLPTLPLDLFAFVALDLLMLDVEGSELFALHGALKSIEKFRPVIVVEDKGLSDHYGYKKGDIEAWLAREFGYEVVARPHRDVVLVPR